MELVCKNVSIGYEDQLVIKNIDFALEKGDYCCVLGENGAGKSSLLKGILGLAKVKDGSIEAPKTIGYLSQQKDFSPNFPATVLEVVLSGFVGKMGFRPFYTKAEKEKAKSLIEEFGMGQFASKPFVNLSGGQKQRILLARALCATDGLLLLDEPVTGLDPAATNDLYALLKKINKEKKTTILMVTHDVAKAVTDADKILHIDGEMTFFGETADYINSKEYKKFEEIYGGNA